jgi:hypothetical protein
MANQLTIHDLFGGAITTVLPTGYLDASDLRQIPDNQEVFLSPINNASIIISLLERVPASDLQSAVKEHFDDAVLGASNRRGENADIPHTRPVEQLPSPHGTRARGVTEAGLVVAAMQTSESDRAHARGKGGEEVVFTGVVMGLVRLASVETDLLVEFNVPHVKGAFDESAVDLEGGQYGGMVDEAVSVVKSVIERLEVKDWGLFGN